MSAEQETLPQSEHFLLERLAEGVYAAMSIAGRGSMCNAGIVDLGEQTLVFDTFLTPAAAVDLLRAAEHLTGHPVSYVVNSHYNADHINGNQVFTDATIISTEQTRDLIATRGVEILKFMEAKLPQIVQAEKEQLLLEQDPALREKKAREIATDSLLVEAVPTLKLRLPELTFERELVLHGTRRRVELISLGGGHTPSDAFLYLPDEHIAFLGDLLFTGMHPSIWQDQPRQWVSILEQIELMDLTTVVPGHGSPGTPEDVVQLRQYFETLLAIITALVETGGTEEDAAHTTIPASYAHWEHGDFEGLMRNLYRSLSHSIER